MAEEKPNHEASELVEAKISAAFGDADVVDMRRYADLVLSSWQRYSDAITRTVLLGFFLGGVFELLVSSSAITSLTVGPVSLSNTAFLQILIPALIAYQIYDVHCLTQKWNACARIYSLAIKRSQPKLYEAGRVDPVLPRTRGPWGPRPAAYLMPGDELEYRAGRAVWIVAFILLPPAFEAQAYYALIHKFGFADILVWISMIASIIFLALWISGLCIVIRHNANYDGESM